ncbi:hypothetical protein PVAP13_1KG434310 [Panicum virgatum]|uniref:Thioesterase domain-containing protein n=1 Tax=Panicum virgatum TaxID=38727 RepID=A0A8T0XFW7_PANVG|nr:hypothetical protein PVAP13_1KG434310 [Panicum virgatum]
MAWQQHKCTMAFSMQQQQSFCFIRPPSNHRQHRRRPPNKQPPARAYMPRSGHLAADLLGRPCPRGRATRAVQAAVSANSNGSEFIRAKNNTIQDTKLPREGKFFEVEMTVRDCELDKYRVVSSAVLAAYMETARQEMLASLGVRTGSIARAGRALAVSKLNVECVAPLKPGARFVVMVRVVQIKGVRMLMEHLIATLPDREKQWPTSFASTKTTGRLACSRKW